MIEYKVTVDEYGTIRWYNADDEFHREDGPAIERVSGTKEWYRNSERHREDGPAVEHCNGDRAWYRNGQLHREGGPAVESLNGQHKTWYRNGKLHREDGPAIEYLSGDKSWYLDDKRLTEEEFLARIAEKPEEVVIDGLVYRRTS